MMEAMQTAPIILYGISNCDTVKRARQWLTAQQMDYRFHDFKSQGVPADHLDRWLSALGWEALLNRSGLTWRGLDDAVKASVKSVATARAVVLAHSSLIKRPVVEWGGAGDDALSVGFKEAAWSGRAHPSRR